MALVEEGAALAAVFRVGVQLLQLVERVLVEWGGREAGVQRLLDQVAHEARVVRAELDGVLGEWWGGGEEVDGVGVDLVEVADEVLSVEVGAVLKWGVRGGD